MICTSLLGEAAALHPLGKVLALAIFYVALAWLPLRGIAALLHHKARRQRAQALRDEADARMWDPYRVGEKVLPPPPW